MEFGEIVDDAAVTLVATKVATSGKRWKRPAGNGFYGHYLGLAGAGVALLCDVRKWMAYAPTPLWLCIYGPSWGRGKAWRTEVAAVRKALASLESATPKALFMARDGFPTVPIFVSAGHEKVEIVGEVVDQVQSVMNLLLISNGMEGKAPIEEPPEE